MWNGVTVFTTFEMSRCAYAGRWWVAAPAISRARASTIAAAAVSTGCRRIR
jgi:hypothetical protein